MSYGSAKRKLSFASSLSNDSFSYKSKSDDAGVVLKHKVKKTKVGIPLKFKDVVDLLAPPIKYKFTYPTGFADWSANQEYVHESLCLDKKLYLNLKLQVANRNGRLWGNVNAVDADLWQTNFKFNGGTFKYIVMNTCNNVVHLEFREYKMKKGLYKDKGLYTTQSPLKLFNLDQSNVTNIGQLPYGSGNAPVLEQLVNDDYLQNWTVSNVATCDSADFERINQAFIPVGKRPGRSSPQLRALYDAGSITKVTLQPGQTFEYNVYIKPFYQHRSLSLQQFIAENDIIQYYTRVVQIFCKSGWNVNDIDKDDGGVDTGATNNQNNLNAFAPGPGNIHIAKQFELDAVAVPFAKTSNNVVEGSYDISGLTKVAGYGPFSTTVINPTRMDADNPANTTGVNEGQVNFNQTVVP